MGGGGAIARNQDTLTGHAHRDHDRERHAVATGPTMNVGVYLDLRNPPDWRRPWTETYGAALELCEEVEARGGHSVWLSEHHLFEDGYLPQPLTFAAAVAARTRRLRIGTAILIAPFREPAQLVEEASIVDLVSGGRLDLGLGAGYRAPEYELFGREPERPLEQLFTCAREMRALLDSGRVTPPPAQSPFPLWMGCNGPVGAYRAGRLGEPLLSIQPQVLEPYRRGLADGGRDPEKARMSGPVSLFLSDEPERDWPVVSEYLAYQWNSYRRASVEGTDRPPPPPVDPERYRRRGLAAGLRGTLIATPDEAAQQLRSAFEGVPVETIFTWGWLPGIREPLVQRHVELLCSELAPRLSTEAAVS